MDDGEDARNHYGLAPRIGWELWAEVYRRVVQSLLNYLEGSKTNGMEIQVNLVPKQGLFQLSLEMAVA
jgi:hypothetical protein